VSGLGKGRAAPNPGKRNLDDKIDAILDLLRTEGGRPEKTRATAPAVSEDVKIVFDDPVILLPSVKPAETNLAQADIKEEATTADDVTAAAKKLRNLSTSLDDTKKKGQNK